MILGLCHSRILFVFVFDNNFSFMHFIIFLSIINRGEVIADADLSSSDSNSEVVLEIFNLFPQVSQQPQQLPPQQLQEQQH